MAQQCITKLENKLKNLLCTHSLSRLHTTNKNFIAATDPKKRHSLSSCPERSKIAGVPLALQQLVLLPALRIQPVLSLLPALQLVLLSLRLVLELVVVSALSSLICSLPHLRVAQMKSGSGSVG